jgi:hypothetical protein
MPGSTTGKHCIIKQKELDPILFFWREGSSRCPVSYDRSCRLFVEPAIRAGDAAEREAVCLRKGRAPGGAAQGQCEAGVLQDGGHLLHGTCAPHRAQQRRRPPDLPREAGGGEGAEATLGLCCRLLTPDPAGEVAGPQSFGNALHLSGKVHLGEEFGVAGLRRCG